MRSRRGLLILVLAAALGAAFVVPYFRGAAFVVRAAGMEGPARRVADWDTTAVREFDMPIAWRDGALRGRAYFPASTRGRTVLLVPGVHAAGIDEPRLIGFARQIAA